MESLGRRRGGSEDQWRSVLAFRRVWLCRCYALSVVEDWLDRLTLNSILGLRVTSDGRFGSLAVVQHAIKSMSAFEGKADVRFEQKSIFDSPLSARSGGH